MEPGGKHLARAPGVWAIASRPARFFYTLRRFLIEPLWGDVAASRARKLSDFATRSRQPRWRSGISCLRGFPRYSAHQVAVASISRRQHRATFALKETVL